MTGQPIEIFQYQPGQIVQAVLYDCMTVKQIVDTEDVWGELRYPLACQRYKEGVPEGKLPQHWHWNWAEKASKVEMLAYQCIGIEYSADFQGMMMIKTVGHSARLEPDIGKPLVYISYIECAPWNVKELVDNPRFGGVGSRLMEAAVRISLEEGFHGRIGLHSLGQAEKYYRNSCKMIDLGLDVNYENLRYFEFDRDAAQNFLRGGLS